MTWAEAVPTAGSVMDTKAGAQAWLATGGKPVTTLQAPAPRLANRPVIRQGSTGHPVHEIIVPCSATRADWMAGRPLAEKVAEIRIWHRAKGRRDIGYHWVIDRDGKVLEWLLDQAADLPIGQRLSSAARAVLPYVSKGAGDALKRLGLDWS